MKASKFLCLTVIALAVVVLSGCEEEDGPLQSENAINNTPSVNSDQDFIDPKDRDLPIPMIQEMSKKENIQEPVDIQSKELAPLSENNYLHAIE